MIKKMRKLVAVFSAISLVLFYTVAPVTAATHERRASNENTGAESVNVTEISTTNNVEVENTNTADVNNDITANSNTGGNSASYNTGGGSVKTGSAATSVASSTTVNTNTTNVECNGCGTQGDVTVQNKNTGFDSTNVGTAALENNVEVENNNHADISNDIYASSDSGNNDADYNTGNGSVKTGTAKTEVSASNTANSNETTVGGNGGNGGSLTLSNQQTGADSENILVASVSNGVEIDNSNRADIDNEVDAYAYTGENSASYNTGDGSVDTGNATIDDVFVRNRANSNETKVGGEGGAGFDVLLENMNTGYNSYNDAALEVESEVDVDNHNSVNVDNDIYADSDTGNNSADYNTADGSVKTGSANTDVAIFEEFNSSETTVDCEACLSVGDVTIRNKDTGANSDNRATFEVENEVDVDNNNHADIDNEVDAYAYTGENSADYNGNGSVDASVETGDADVDVLVDDAANRNVTNLESARTSGIDVTVENMNTGYNSYNDASIDVETDLDIDNDNRAWVDNDVYADSDTGNNSADYNTADGTVKTGDATTDVDMEADLNLNLTDVECPVCGAGNDLKALNKTTGADSENLAEVNLDQDFDIDNENEADIDVWSDAYAYTGRNSASYNTGAGDIETGNGDADTVLDVAANKNDTNMPKGNGSSLQTAENMNTGFDSVNTSEVSAENEVELDNENNLDVLADLYADSDTGNNNSDFNTGAGLVETGRAQALTWDFTTGNFDL